MKNAKNRDERPRVSSWGSLHFFKFVDLRERRFAGLFPFMQLMSLMVLPSCSHGFPLRSLRLCERSLVDACPFVLSESLIVLAVTS